MQLNKFSEQHSNNEKAMYREIVQKNLLNAFHLQ